MSFELLNQELQKIIAKKFIQPTLPQKLAIPKILEGKNILLIAPVASGKTESALLPVFHFIMQQKPRPISALYISPLKALNRDLLKRIVWWCNQTGIDSSVRHGDTSAYERKMQVEFPVQLLILTLETLQPILVGKKLREHLKNVKWVIVDEVHEIVGSKRGVQLALALERLRELCGDFQLIMLSATVGEPEKVAKFFSGGKEVEIIKATLVKQMEIKVISPKPELKDKKIAEKIFSSEETAARLRTIMELIRNSRSTLTFTNTRDFAEILTSRIKLIDKKFPVGIHHSSLSKEVRIKAEEEFKQEKIKSLIATSSLQLGIDIGSIDLILQYQSPRQVTQLVQRVGRSGHALEKVSKGIIITTDEDDIFESAVVARRALKEELEEIRFHENSLDVLAHQILGLALEFRGLEIKKTYEIVRRSYPYRNLSYKEFLEVCEQLQKLGLIFLNKVIKKSRKGIKYYFDNLSVIPSLKQYKIFNTLNNSFVGVLDEEFVALHGEPGSSFIVKGEAWRIIDVLENKVLVEPTEDVEAVIPGWEGELIPVPFEVAQEVGMLRRKISEYLKKMSEEDIEQKLREAYPIDENCSKKMVEIVKRQLKYALPDDKTILIEDSDTMLIIHSCLGSLINETLGRFLSALLTARIGSIKLKTDPYRIMIQFPDPARNYLETIKEILFEKKPEYLRSYIEVSIVNSPLFEWRFVHVGKRFGAIAKDAEYGKVKMRKIIEDYASSPIYKETLKELEIEKLDLKRTEEILRKIQNKEIKVVFKSGLSPLGKIGLKHQFAEVVSPEKPEKEILKIFKERILNTKVRLVCLNCGLWDQVFTVREMPENVRCKKCEARLLGIVNPRDQEILKIVKKKIRKLATVEETKKFEKVRKSAELFMDYKKKAVYCLAARGVGPNAAVRILARFHRTEDELFKDILNAERTYYRTKRYWSV